MTKVQCTAHLFYGTRENHIWVLCENCASQYLVDNSPINYMAKAEFSDVMSCDKCKKNLVFDEDQCYIDKSQKNLESDDEERDTNPPPPPCSNKEFSLVKVKEALGLVKKP